MALVKCNECGKDISSNASSCPNCGNPTNNKQYNNDNNTTAKVISFIFPIIGLIIYAINVNKNNNLAKECLKWALIGLFIVPVIIILIFLILRLGYNSSVNEAKSFVKVPIAYYYIDSNEVITNDKIEYINLPKSSLDNKDIIVDIESIVGHKTNMNCTIPEGSLFYKSCIE